MKKLRIGIIGTRGIPNYYGGFEQLAEHLSAGLVKSGHDVFVYNSHNHPNKEKKWNGVSIVHCHNPETILGTAGQFIYDLNCVLDARRRDFDVMLVLGYTSISVWAWLFPRKSAIIFNMDGLEWKRSKYSLLVKKFLLQAEKLAAEHKDYYIADSPVIQSYLKSKYKIESRYIPYGADVPAGGNEKVLQLYRINKNEYFILVARIERENNIEMILDGFSTSNSKKKFIVIGDATNKFGKYLVQKFRKDERIRFAGTMYNKEIKHSLCFFSAMYFHGHSTGGTNPSLLEAMGSQALIAAHNNEFNRQILNCDALYFSGTHDVKNLIENNSDSQLKTAMIKNNQNKIETVYRWESIISQYETFITACHKNHSTVEGNIYHKRESYQ
jgi:glycosyltransferase involved in cell wall biosynthesis